MRMIITRGETQCDWWMDDVFYPNYVMTVDILMSLAYIVLEMWRWRKWIQMTISAAITVRFILGRSFSSMGSTWFTWQYSFLVRIAAQYGPFSLFFFLFFSFFPLMLILLHIVKGAMSPPNAVGKNCFRRSILIYDYETSLVYYHRSDSHHHLIRW